MANVLIAFLVICVGCAVAAAVAAGCWLALRDWFAARGRVEVNSAPVAAPVAPVVATPAAATGRHRTWLRLVTRPARKRRAAVPL